MTISHLPLIFEISIQLVILMFTFVALCNMYNIATVVQLSSNVRCTQNHEIGLNCTCSNITDLTDHQFFCKQNDTPFFFLLIPSVLQGLSFLLVFMTALEFICAQAPLRLKGLLIGLWYASLAVNYLLVGVAEAFITDSNSWEIFNKVKAFRIFLFLMFYLCVSKSYRYRKRDEVIIPNS